MITGFSKLKYNKGFYFLWACCTWVCPLVGFTVGYWKQEESEVLD